MDSESVPGQPLEIRTAEPVWVQLPDGETIRLESEEGRAVLPDPGLTGVYRVRAGDRAWPVAMNMLDPRESDLSSSPPGPSEGPPDLPPPDSSQPTGVAEFWPWLALAGLLALLAEWLMDQRARRPWRPRGETP